MSLRLLFLGDIMGRPARDEACRLLPDLRARLKLDAVIINVENAAHGYGVTAQICKEFYDAGADCLTTGNHVWDQREIISYIDRDPKLLRPLNYPQGTPGRGITTVTTQSGYKLTVVNVMTRLYMESLDDPFAALRGVLDRHVPGKTSNALVIDVHGEAASEKMAIGHLCDGVASLVVGTHTHVPTADLRIMQKGTAYQTDAGMCGCYDSVIGMETSISLGRFISKVPGERNRPAEGPVTLCGTLVDIDPATGLCVKAEMFRMGGVLPQALPA